jgi:type IV pilus assembly protein PilQ
MAFRTAIASAVIATLSTLTIGADKPAAVSQTQVVPAPRPPEVSSPTTPAVIQDPFADADAIPVPAAEPKSLKSGDVKYDQEQGTVEIHVNDAAIVEVLRMLSAQSQKNIIASKEVKGAITANLYGVTVKEALEAILVSNGYAYRERGNFIFVYTAKELREIDRAARVVKTEVFRLFYTPAGNAVTMIKPVLSESAQVSFTTPAQSGISSGTGDVGGNSHAVEDMMVVTDFTENLEAVRNVLREVDRRPQQILIEATILRAALGEDNALGVDFNLLAGVNLNNIVSNNNGQITGAGTGPITGSNATSVGTGNSFSSSVPGGLKVGFVSDNVSVFLSALEGVTDTVVMANPKILALNKQKGEVIVGRKDGYLTTTTTDTSTVQTVEFLDTGTRLVFRPFIGDDGYVRMEIHPEDSSGGLTGANLPFKITTEVTSNIMVKDGNTVVIGGLFRESSETARSQTPVLGNIPIAGNLFRQQRDRTLREEIIILLTPHVIKDDTAFSEAAQALAADGDKMRVGVRKGMMPWGRERLAECAYDSAQAEMKKASPDTGKVLWHLNIATNLNPKFLEAIKLKERLTGRTLTAATNSSMRDFVRQQVLADRAADRSAQSFPRSVDVTPAGPAATQPAAAPAVAPAVLRTEAPTTRPATDDLVVELDAVPATQPAEENLVTLLDSIDVPKPEKPAVNASSPQSTVTVLPDEQ